MVDHEDKSILPRHCRNCKEVVNIDNEFEMTSQWAILPAPVRYDPDLPANAKLLYAEIAAKTNATGFCWASNDFFARQMKLSADSVSRLIKTLETAEYIVVAVDPAAINEKRREIYLTPKGFGLRGGIGKNADTPSRQKCRDRPGKNAETGIGKNADPNIIENNNNKNNRAERPKYVPLDVLQAMADYAGEGGDAAPAPQAGLNGGDGAPRCPAVGQALAGRSCLQDGLHPQGYGSLLADVLPAEAGG